MHSTRLPFLAIATAVTLASGIELIRLVVALPGSVPFVALAATVAGCLLAIRHPWPGLAIAALATVVAGVAGWEPIVEWSCAVFLLFAVALRRGRPFLGALIVAPPVVVGTALVTAQGQTLSTAFGALVSVAAAAAIAFGLRTQRQYRDALEQRAADAVATRELEADRRVAEERLRIARDLHDVVGHEIAVVSMHLGVAEVSTPEDARAAHDALVQARAGVRNVLTETQRILAVLRDAGEDTPVEPTPALDGVPALVASYRGIGLDVTATLPEPLPEVDPATGVTAYRVLQEALTNALRHGPGTAEVVVATDGSELRIEVRNARAHDRSSGEGSRLGLIGMRERVAATGGSLVAEPDGMLFALTARLPIGRTSQ